MAGEVLDFLDRPASPGIIDFPLPFLDPGRESLSTISRLLQLLFLWVSETRSRQIGVFGGVRWCHWYRPNGSFSRKKVTGELQGQDRHRTTPLRPPRPPFHEEFCNWVGDFRV